MRKKSPSPDNSVSRESSPESDQKVPERKEIKKEQRKRYIIGVPHLLFGANGFSVQVQEQVQDTEPVRQQRINSATVPGQEREETQEQEQEQK